MSIALLTVTLVFAVLLLVSATGKIMHAGSQMETMRKVGFPENRVELLAAAEVAGAIGLVLGMWYWPIGVAAAIGLIMYFVGAVGAHVLKRDWNITASVVLLAVAIAVLVLRLMTR